MVRGGRDLGSEMRSEMGIEAQVGDVGCTGLVSGSFSLAGIGEAGEE